MGISSGFSASVTACATQLAEEGPAALGALFDLTSQRLVRYAVAISRNQHDAEDAVQAALARVASEPHRLCRASQPWPYLLQMVRNQALLTMRKKRRLRFFADLRDLFTRCPVDELEREEVHRAVWEALRRLPTPQAEVVVLKIWEEMTYAQIAEVLTISPDTAASRYRYAMRKLSGILAAEQGGVCEEVPHG